MTGADAVGQSGQGLDVLLVEDEPDISGLMRFCLEDDYRDFMLGEGTAADWLPRLRRLQPAAWIVVYTANRAAAEFVS